MSALLLLAAASAWAAPAGGTSPGAEAVASALASEVRVPIRIETVMPQGHIEGHAVSIARLQSALPAPELLAAARSAWAKSGAGRIVEAASGPWSIVSVRAAGGFLTLQARPAAQGGSEALLSVWRDPPQVEHGQASAAPNRIDRWLPEGATVLRRLAGTDTDRQGTTVVARVRAEVPWALAAVESRLLADGLRRDPVVRTRGDTAGGEARLYRGAGREVAVTALPHPSGTAIVLHLVEGSR